MTQSFPIFRLVEEANDLAPDVLATRLLLVHDPGGGGEDNVAELTGRQEPYHPLLEVRKTDVVARRDDTSLVQAVCELTPRQPRPRGPRLTGRSAEQQFSRSGGRQPPRTRQCSLRDELATCCGRLNVRRHGV